MVITFAATQAQLALLKRVSKYRQETLSRKTQPANRVGEPSGFLKLLPPLTFMPDNTNQPIRDTGEPGMNEVLARNIRTLLEKRRAEERKASIEQKVADAITRFTGSMPFVYLHAVFFGLWILINLRWLGWFGISAFDPSFVVLAMIASVEAIFLSTFILISQNRMNATSERRADLDLHISLLAEHEITKILQLVSQLAERIGIPDGNSSEMAELKRDVAPAKVLDKIEERSSQCQ